jgi:DNA polymerase III delta prime subunit
MDYNLTPKYFNEFKYHTEIIKRLEINKDENIINSIFVGVNNSGKKTLINAYLNHIFSADIHLQKKINSYELKIGNNIVNIEYISSIYHFELNLYEFGYYDKNIITDFIQNIIKYKSINLGKLKIIVINHFDKITKLAQLALRRIVEKSLGTARFILCCESLSKIDKSILSRFQIIRIPKPKPISTYNYIKYHLDKNKISFNSPIIESIQERTNNDLFNINIELQYIITNNSLEKKLIIYDTTFIKPIIDELYKKDLQSLYVIKDLAYKYLLINIKPKQILKEIFRVLIKKFKDEKKKQKLLLIVSEAEKNMSYVHYNIICLEYFILKVKKLLLT